MEFQIDLIDEVQSELEDLEQHLSPLMAHLGRNGGVELVLVSPERIQELNNLYRGVDKPTDVLSFPIDMPAADLLGSVVINIEQAKEEAQKRGHRLLDEVTLLFLHGYLHLLGYDHESDNGEQRALEEEIIQAFNLPPSLIVRTENL
ncbi:rRNA maturation RNase YbeY [Helicobacter ailurogastricus]|uniref:Endoribonuclease YbeY n=1 Tax=Helicobacter ailurogastricus TaxID=1578720 RepID=A0A0K2XFX5_9HELI|nr:rRNA maturation RNase YbeY [Helicobacter ailurogastricus]CRF42450.1 Metal-dependent hydrolase YbeY, involved in rRNA and/or ribosome maturation and assembly [Helicobacter ailurogastricus]CRF43644.1 Metal-dependent hydrolase YbeY, involved in rRNA and/or ribosome maturation and assembly [Helicobacter ailurogastricus]GLH57623.1 Probable rRNA maturation factor YbeY [Helicobacter ailurogastricus]GLH59969.1 Probable rRNA maturation factor YbeY [Helicobacter ailurogastricus]GMB89840.1 Probable rR